MKKFLIFLGAGVALIGLWLSTLIFVPQFARFLISEGPQGLEAARGAIAAAGSVGDMFGAINALFSALALGAVALTLWTDVRSRRRSRKPLVVANVSGVDSIVLERPVQMGQAVLIPLKIPFRVSNQTDDAALNVSLRCYLGNSDAVTLESFVDGPILRNVDQDVLVETQLPQHVYMPFLNSLTAHESVVLRVVARYGSLEGVSWATEVTYLMKWRDDPGERAMLNSVRGGTWMQDWGVEADVPLAAAIKVGTWKHKPA